MSRTKKRVLTLLLAIILFCGSGAVGYAFLPGDGPMIVAALWQIESVEEKNKLEQFMEKITVLRNQLEHSVREAQFFRESVVGAWRDPLILLRDERSRIIALGTETRNLAWEPRVHSPVLDRAREASERVRRVMDEGGAPDGPALRDSLEDLYEPANNTRTGGRSEAAMREMAEAASFIGQVNQQLKEQYDIIEEAYQKAQAGGLAADEVARLGVVTQTELARAQGLSQQAQLRALRLQMTQLGYQVAAANERDRSRLNEQEAAGSSVYLFKPVPGVPSLGDLQPKPAIRPE
jgi:hypothetical protein